MGAHTAALQPADSDDDDDGDDRQLTAATTSTAPHTAAAAADADADTTCESCANRVAAMNTFLCLSMCVS